MLLEYICNMHTWSSTAKFSRTRTLIVMWCMYLWWSGTLIVGGGIINHGDGSYAKDARMLVVLKYKLIFHFVWIRNAFLFHFTHAHWFLRHTIFHVLFIITLFLLIYKKGHSLERNSRTIYFRACIHYFKITLTYFFRELQFRDKDILFWDKCSI